jgi:hypothetical protein
MCAGCVAGESGPAPTETSTTQAVSTVSFRREHVVADIYHYEARIPVGTSPNAALRVHRVVRELGPYVPRPTSHAAMLLHGDFSTFITNFAPTLGDPASPASGLAPYLAAHDIDVWGLDRRWTLPGETGDISDFGTMGLSQDLDDLRATFALVRALRATSGSGGPFALVGFSHGAEIAYAYTATEAALPRAQRHVDALVALDFFGAYGADQADLRAASCANAAAEYGYVAAGVTDGPNDLQIVAGAAAAADPSGPSQLVAGFTNEQLMLSIVGQTYAYAPITPLYHLLSPVLDSDGNPTSLRLTSDPASDAWLANSPPHEAMLEAADLDAQLCGDAPPVTASIAQIRVPLLYIGAAGGVGAAGLDATALVGSPDVTVLIWQLFGADQIAADVGHADLLYAPDARAAAWQPLVDWIDHH